MALKERWIGQLKQTRAYRQVRLLAGRIRLASAALLARLRPAHSVGGRHSLRPTRILCRFLAM